MDLVGKADALDMKFRNTTNGYCCCASTWPATGTSTPRSGESQAAPMSRCGRSRPTETRTAPMGHLPDSGKGGRGRLRRRAAQGHLRSPGGHTQEHHTVVRRPGGTRRALEPKTDGPRGVAVEAEQHAPRSKGFKVQEEILEAAEDVRDWLEDRRASSAPREMIDGREGRHRWTLMAKIATVAGEA
jgi:hypothetical protein